MGSPGLEREGLFQAWISVGWVSVAWFSVARNSNSMSLRTSPADG
jgi:hypothetical protein